MSYPLFGLLFFILIILLIISIGQFFYKKYPMLGVIIFALGIVLLFYAIYDINNSDSKLGDKGINEFVGTYELDIEHSSYDVLNIAQYKNLQLIVSPNKTFVFSNKNPFFKDSTGNWQLLDDGDILWAEISVGKGKFMQEQIEPKKWVFSGSILNSNKESNSIIFIRK